MPNRVSSYVSKSLPVSRNRTSLKILAALAARAYSALSDLTARPMFSSALLRCGFGLAAAGLDHGLAGAGPNAARKRWLIGGPSTGICDALVPRDGAVLADGSVNNAAEAYPTSYAATIASRYRASVSAWLAESAGHDQARKRRAEPGFAQWF